MYKHLVFLIKEELVIFLSFSVLKVLVRVKELESKSPNNRRSSLLQTTLLHKRLVSRLSSDSVTL